MVARKKFSSSYKPRLQSGWLCWHSEVPGPTCQASSSFFCTRLLLPLWTLQIIHLKLDTYPSKRVKRKIKFHEFVAHPPKNCEVVAVVTYQMHQSCHVFLDTCSRRCLPVAPSTAKQSWTAKLVCENSLSFLHVQNSVSLSPMYIITAIQGQQIWSWPSQDS